jgi:hypothetical protein
MAAKEFTIYVPKSFRTDTITDEIARKLSLAVDELPESIGLSYQFSAQKGEGKSYMRVEFAEDQRHVIKEISEWERPSAAYKEMLLNCRSSITIYYRDLSLAKNAVAVIAELMGNNASSCIVDNGEGCLLKFESIIERVRQDSNWTWEKTEFPEFPGVATSEWSDS